MTRRLDVCCWCGKPSPKGKSTREHVIPRWALPFLSAPIIGLHTNTESRSCQTCNSKKGPMPPALFVLVRHDANALARARRQWDSFASIAANCAATGEILPADVRVHIEGWMSRTIEVSKNGRFFTRPEAWVA